MMGTATEYTLRQILERLYPHSVWDLDGVTQVFEYATNKASFYTLYTVPAGKVLYITSIFCWGRTLSETAHYVTYMISGLADAGSKRWQWYINPGEEAMLALTFPTPLKVLAGGTVGFSAGGTSERASGAVTGYTLPA